MKLTDVRVKFKELTALSADDMAARDEIAGLLANLDFRAPPPPAFAHAPPPLPRGVPIPPPPPPGVPARPAVDSHLAFLNSSAGQGRLSFEAYLVRYCLQPSADAYYQLHAAIFAAFERCRAGGPDSHRHRAFLEWLVRELEAEGATRYFHVALGVPGDQYLTALSPVIQVACRLACLDATAHQQFVNADCLAIVRNRALAMANAAPPPNARIPMVGALSAADVLRFGHGIRAYGGAECYGLAVVAASLIVSAPLRGTVEIVSNGVHKWIRFTSVGGSVIFVDLWLGTVGNPVFYPRAEGYPFNHRHLDVLFKMTK